MLLGIALTLGACSQQPAQETPEQAAEKLDQAAQQSDPKAAEVMNKRADQLRGQSSVAPAGEPGSYTQDTMQQAGAAASQSDGAAQ